MIKFARSQGLLGILLVLGLIGARSAQPTPDTPPPTVPASRASQSASTADNDVDLSHFPVTINTCGRSITFNAPPQRVVTNDVNITELFLALDLQDRLVGYSSIRNDKQLAPAYRAKLEGVPVLAERYPSLEVLSSAGPDLYLAGWNYGLSAESGLTPASLAKFGIETYAITESCIRVMPRHRVSLEDTFTDLLNIGRLFGVAARAQKLVETYRAELAVIRATVGEIETPLRVFVYDSGDATPMTAAKFATPNAMIEAAGGTNVFNDVGSSWTRINWEHVVDRNPQVIVIIDYDSPDAAGKIAFLKHLPKLADVDAIKHDKFVVLTYSEATPGPCNVAATRRLAAAFYPDRFSAVPVAARASSRAPCFPMTLERSGPGRTDNAVPAGATTLP